MGKANSRNAGAPVLWGRGWIAAKALVKGDLLRRKDGTFAVVEEVFDTGVEETLYNCTVSDYHTYFVGGEDWGFSVWAHNECWSTARSNYWKNLAAKEAANPTGKFSAANLERMLEGKAPLIRVRMQSRNDPTQIIERDILMELHHQYFTQRGGARPRNEGWNLTPVTPWAHEAMDSFRHVGWDLLKIIKGKNSF